MKRSTIILLAFFSVFLYGNAQSLENNKRQKIVLITLDGFRWQELFTGADKKLINCKKYVEDTAELKEKFWRNTPEERRIALMPFFWNEISKMGQLHGNRNYESVVNVSNAKRFSYPGYNEILTGSADDKRVDSNKKVNNPNITVLEKINNDSNYKGKVAAFGSWAVIPFIINEERSGIPVNAGFEEANGSDLSSREVFLNELQSKVPSPWGSVRLDAFTSNYALEYMKREHPELIFLSYGETDDFAHDGNYQAYLKSAHSTDALIKEIWNFTQKDAFYKDNTIFIISTDHGRGSKRWRRHGSNVRGSEQVWLIVFGNNVQALGEIKSKEQLYSNQIAPTILKLLKQQNDPEMKGKPLSNLKK
ncbi:sulfatase-like hydrolase/transferase [Flavobacterium sp.]|uniref:sulfatase-like hydrolase/transferase n=1 Tax=Flavobacterium sp. TaxID=239 RepID=UPI002BD8704B|nr:sulfatase-like hydrolase/transferase [Flavobacterium sp.]HSD06659.1 sulfatase-like hydrolase/transferase [Flavobacterium sp.]